MMMVVVQVVVNGLCDGVCDSVSDDAGAGVCDDVCDGVCCDEGSGRVKYRHWFLVIEAVGNDVGNGLGEYGIEDGGEGVVRILVRMFVR